MKNCFLTSAWLMTSFAHITFQQVPRADNKAADAMATLASLLQMPENDLRHEFLVEMLHYLPMILLKLG